MATRLTLEVTTPRGLAFQVEADFVQAPSVAGEFTILPNHLPVLAAMRPGILRYSQGGKVHVAAVGPGFIEAEPDRVVVLTDLYATPESVDVEKTREELASAVEALKKFGDAYEGSEFEVLQRRIDWAQSRLDAAALR